MNRLIKSFMKSLIILSLVACGSYGEGVNLSKDGILYEVSYEVDVYYPKKWDVIKLDTTEVALSSYTANSLIHKDPSAIQVDFYSENASELLRFNRMTLSSDNTSTEMIQLFCEDLKLLDIETSYKMSQLANGVPCYEVVGIYKAGHQKMKWVVAYRGNIGYTYFYKADSDVFDEKMETMSTYLYSMEIQE